MKSKFLGILLAMLGIMIVSCKKDIEANKVDGVSLDKTELSLVVGASEKLTATVTPEDADDKRVTWSSSAEDVATVDANGNVAAVKEGTAVITVKTVDGGKTATCNVTVSASVINVESVTLDQTDLTLEAGSSAKLTATVAPENATDKSVTWSSSDKAVATVDAEGNVTAVKVGTAVITVTTVDGGKTATCNVTVSASAINVESVTLDQTDLTLEAGSSAKLTATVAPENATDKSVTWSSSDETVATVDAEGNVAAVKEGSAVVTVTTVDGGKTATCNVTVTPKVIHPESVALDQTDLVLYEGESAKLTATVAPEDADDKSVTWSSSDETVATVDAEGNVAAVKEGTAVITVTTVDGGKTATCNVTVNAVPSITITGETFYKDRLAFGGEVVKLTADAADVVWSTSDETVATVDAEGNVTFLNDKDGAPVTILATGKDGAVGSIDFIVNVTYFEFLNVRYDAGSTIQLPYNKMRNLYVKAMAGTTKDSRISCKLYTINVEDTGMVSAYTDDSMGRMIGVTGKKLGTTKLTVTFNDSGFSLFVNLEVVQ